MIQRQKSYMKATEDDTLEMIERLDNTKVFIKTMPTETQQRIINQYQRTKECILSHGSEHKITLDQMRSLAEDLIQVRHFTSASTVLDRACLGCKRCYGQAHVNVALVYCRQAYALSCDRKFEPAYNCYERSLLLLEDLFNFRVFYSPSRRREELHDTGVTVIPTIAVPVVDGLGYTLGALLRHRESEFCFRTLLNYYISTDPTIDRTQEPYLPADPSIPLGRQHPEALKAINKLASALQAQGKFAEAEQLCSDSLDDCIATLGANHPTTQTSVVTMAQLKHSQGKIAEAEQMYRRSLACNEEVLGVSHIETLANVMQIAGLRAEQKDYRGAETLYMRALSGYEAVLGPHNSSTIEAVHCVGAMLLKQQRPTQALPYLDRALEERSAYYGDAHPATLATLFCVGKAHHLESLWKHRSDYYDLVAKALSILETALAGTDNVLGKSSPQSIEICEYLAEVLLQCNRFAAAVPYSRRAYQYYHTSDGGTGGSSSGSRGGSALRTSGTVTGTRRSVSVSGSNRPKSAPKPDPGVGGIKIIYGPMHKRTADAAYQLATLLENCSHETGASDAARHIEAANLFMQAHEAYKLLLEQCSADADYCRRNSTRRRYEYNYDSAEGKVPDEELSLEELQELCEDALEQHDHALRRSQY